MLIEKKYSKLSWKFKIDKFAPLKFKDIEGFIYLVRRIVSQSALTLDQNRKIQLIVVSFRHLHGGCIYDNLLVKGKDLFLISNTAFQYCFVHHSIPSIWRNGCSKWKGFGLACLWARDKCWSYASCNRVGNSSFVSKEKRSISKEMRTGIREGQRAMSRNSQRLKIIYSIQNIRAFNVSNNFFYLLNRVCNKNWQIHVRFEKLQTRKKTTITTGQR